MLIGKEGLIAFWAYVCAYLFTAYVAQLWPTEQFYSEVFERNRADFQKLVDFVKSHPKIDRVGDSTFGGYYYYPEDRAWKRDYSDKGKSTLEILALYGVTLTDLHNCRDWSTPSGLQFARKSTNHDYYECAFLDGMGRGWFYSNGNHMAYGVFGPRVYVQLRDAKLNTPSDKADDMVPFGWSIRTTIDQAEEQYFKLPDAH